MESSPDDFLTLSSKKNDGFIDDGVTNQKAFNAERSQASSNKRNNICKILAIESF